MKKDIDALKGELDMFKKRKLNSQRSFYQFREDCCASVREEFVTRMRNQGHLAELKFVFGGTRGELADLDTDKGEIRIKTLMDGIARGKTPLDLPDEGRSFASASGGEKSWAANSLVASIAKEGTQPFRIIDEFDVFQDEQTRQKTLRMLVADASEGLAGAAAEGGGTKMQYILLTPHDISSAVVAPNKNVTIHRLSKPAAFKHDDDS